MEGENFNETVSEIALSEKEIIYCENYAIYANGSKAAAIAGYNHPKESSSQLLKKPDIQSYLKALRAKAAEMAGVTIIRNLMELAAIAYPGIGKDAEGNEVDVYMAKPTDRIKAIEIINKMCAFNAPEELNVNNKSELDGKTDEELAAIIEAKRSQRKALSE
jgi:phage terminase small subunit